ncbi:uncharacterized protein MEPE_01467 [Melanopsichium pennsylvanicum]|uniref:Uncharacterized protein n=2 Tax=Melanopsichium pennsylvanicum TaxID=63383 RepID=A0AAJ4XIT8_9BASI|nr:uncharacterized protein BN887_03204 [Melanopsichium pennsylvanicum 4]SNX82761.1 uncharacterized protein MEPE_01467 [Melanopsichium pennsylvanicum]
MWQSGRLILLAALAAACLLQHAQAGRIQAVPRAVADDSASDRASKLSRRWMFGWDGSLSPAPKYSPTKIHIIAPDFLRDNRPATDSEAQRELDRLAKRQAQIFWVTFSQ